MRITSPAFAHDGDIPTRHTCEGEDLSPALVIEDVPPGARSLVLVVDDPDAPDPKAPRRTWAHWVLYDIPPGCDRIAEGSTPLGARVGANDWGHQRWNGPCPPIGRHRYLFRLYALDVELGDRGALTRPEVLDALADHVVATATLIGRYQKQDRPTRSPPAHARAPR